MMVWVVPLLAALSLGSLVWVMADVSSRTLQRVHDHQVKQLETQLDALFLFVDIRKLLLLNVSVLILALLLSWILFSNLLVTGLLGIFFLFLPRIVYVRMRKRRLRRIESQLPDAILSLAGALRAGSSLNTGLMQLAQELRPPLSQEIELIVREQRLGVSLDVALNGFAKRIPLSMVVLLVSTIRIAAETGGELAEALVRTSNTLRSIAQAEGKIAALTAQGKMQAWVVGLLPVLLLLVLTRMEPEAMGKLWTTALGWGAIAAMVFLEFMGIWLIRRIVDIDV